MCLEVCGSWWLPPDGDQLVLALDWGSEPWEGRSPRGLTKGFIPLFLRQAPPKKRERRRECPEQLALFEGGKGRRGFSPAAPLLLEPGGA